MLQAQMLLTIGFILVLIGFAIAFIAALFLAFSAVKVGKMKGGGAVLVGPFPIIFGTDKESIKIVVMLTIALIVIALTFMLASIYLVR